MPSSVPEGMRLELSRASVVTGRENEFEEWISAVNNRYDENERAFSNERQVFDATFKHREADRQLWHNHAPLGRRRERSPSPSVTTGRPRKRSADAAERPSVARNDPPEPFTRQIHGVAVPKSTYALFTACARYRAGRES